MSNSAHWAVSAGNKFREVARTTENLTTKRLAEGLTHLSEAVRELHQEVEHLENRVKALGEGKHCTAAIFDYTDHRVATRGLRSTHAWDLDSSDTCIDDARHRIAGRRQR